MDLLEAAALRAWAMAARTALGAAADRIDAVNVFPVADSDTGTNVLLTVVGGADAVALVPADAAAADVARAFGRGALLAARGNSGVIVSQYLTGFARALPARAGAPEVAHALTVAARAAREATVEPQEGTVLTLADVVAGAAATAADAGADLATTLAESVAEALRALGRISAVHPVLRAARVLDAGACALLVVLDALARAVGDERPVHVPLDWLPTTAADHASVETTGGAYEVMLLVSDDAAAHGAAVDTGAELRRRMGALGDSVAVVGGDGWWHVHVHTDQPTAAITAAALGRREQILVRLLAGAHAGGSALHDRADGRERWGVVVCTAAPDLAAWYAAAGAVVLVRCPEAPVRAEHLERAVTDTGAAHVVLLPGTGAEVSTAPSVPGVVIETLDAADEVRAVVGSLALAGEGPTAQGRTAAQAALARLGVRTVEAASVHAVADAVDALVRTPRPTPAESLTVLGRDAPDGALLDALVAHLATHHPGIEATVVGPTGHGPALVLGLD
ncbi:DAK2 domain-containing protein [Cellulomonas humilata]|uniref:Dihydroxyacetone kinase-like predicted kinase n=1 Tax=Cellulomonas humilata TaxID=144055 RepID=A0ABU0EEP5_9CELL|nr:DAK2 domain-containing protein [Cellulomonas humilata]MDQ0373312.1 dihydroxyacetone kinase-like predicted kinase [Cellulomonas humilata]